MNNIKTFKNFNEQDIFKYIENRDIQSIKNYINASYNLNIKDDYGCTPLIYASRDNNIEIVKLLLNAGADIDKQNNYGYTALILAAYKNNHEIVKILLDYGADEFILHYNNNKSFYDYLNDENKEYFIQNYPTSVYKAIYHNYKKSFTEFVKDFNIKIKK